MDNIDEKIRIKQMEMSIEENPERKAELHKQMTKLQLQKEIAVIRKKIEQLG
ncbi:hypothetical protein [Flavobacterium salmonis]|uniref:Uncharacterized protein n=1 Tax=Flavobacterium salmonis TaxID=2654844 RepID=A0A6V6ZAT9_9FLAO|nr:hypothetical protein [Flavobacterium salmonis]CAD0008901.1 hypothetical protein FLAT13_04624 [Flavobacterium salmonis]